MHSSIRLEARSTAFFYSPVGRAFKVAVNKRLTVTT
jgi:hypothetical protein